MNPRVPIALVVVGLAAAALLLGWQRAAAADDHCPPPGGADRTFVPTPGLMGGDHELRLVGGGWGHAVGMSQYGARGAAELGCSHHRILTTYYQGTRVEQRTVAGTVRVGFLQLVPQVHLRHEGEGDEGNIRWHVCDDGSCRRDDGLRDQRPGEVWRVRTLSDGAYVIDQGGTEIFRGARDGTVRALHEGTVIRVTDRHPDDAPGFSRRVRWGFHQLTAGDEARGERSDRLHAVQHVTSSDGHRGMERYLWGVAEVPSSWHVEALRAQAVTARSFASRRIGLSSRDRACRCDLYPTVADQHYTGWAKESETSGGMRIGQRWKDAVNTTAGRVVTYHNTQADRWDVADTFYSSSVGGWTENSEDVWVAPVGYLRSIDTSRWEAAGGSPHQRWERGFSTEELRQRFDLDEFHSFGVPGRSDGGRPISGASGREPGVEVRGRKDGQTVTRRYSGEQLRSTLGLRSGLVYVPAERRTPAARRGGDDRIGTTVSVARYGWSSASSVVIARADDPADALAGASLAGQLDAPLLVTHRDRLAEEVAQVVTDLGVRHAVLLGGEQALGPAVERRFTELGVVPERVYGDNRTETAAEVADRLAPPPRGTALLVYASSADPGRGWADALSASGLSARRAAGGQPWPILLTGERLPRLTRDALARHDITDVWLIGGPAVIPDPVADELRELGYKVVRRAGQDRYGTSRAITAVDRADGPVIAVTGRSFPDGLAAGALAGRLDGSVLLVPRGSLDDASGHRKWIRDRITRQPVLVVVGGTSAVSDIVMSDLRDELRLR